jgi:hypothetical protein
MDQEKQQKMSNRGKKQVRKSNKGRAAERGTKKVAQ